MGLSKNIAYRLRTLRESAGLSQQEVADRADLSLSLIAKMEQGRKADPRASTLLALATALGVRPGQLIEDLTTPPEGMFPKKGKKGKKKKKKMLASLMATVGTGDAGHATGADASSHDAAPSSHAANGLSVAPDTHSVAGNGHAEKEGKKKKKKTR